VVTAALNEPLLTLLLVATTSASTNCTKVAAAEMKNGPVGALLMSSTKTSKRIDEWGPRRVTA
jgi:hypothetical protein